MSDLGHHAGGVVGFLKGIRHLVEKICPTQVFVVWEGGGSPRRRAIFPEYKGNRRPQRLNRFYGEDIPDTVENRNYQISLLVEILKKTPVVQLYVSDCEADDVIGYLSKYKLTDQRCVIVSSDKDFYQLIDDRVTQWSPGQKRFIDKTAVVKKFGIPTHNFCVARCFCGDSSDGIPGIKGAGFKTLSKRFPEITEDDDVSVEDILQLSLERSVNSKVKLFDRINDDPNTARRNWKLMFLDMSNMSASQIKKINDVIDTFSPSRDKIGLMRVLIREGIKDFDSDTFCMVTYAILGKI
jgi:DNA polymerase-1